MALTLRVVTGPASGQIHQLAGPGTIVIGRSPRCGLVLPSDEGSDLRVSQAHSLVEYNPPTCQVYDLHSRNGTRVNGTVVTVSPLVSGDVITVGSTQIRVELPDNREAIQAAERTPTEAVESLPLCPACRRDSPLAGGVLCGRCEQSAADLVQTVPGYRLVKEFGLRTVCRTYQAIRLADSKRRAVKTILPPNPPSASHLARFLDDMTRLRRLRHPHIARNLESGILSGGAYLVSEYVHGMDLRRVLKRWGPMSVPNAVRAVRHALAGLAHAHSVGAVHGGLKPATLLLEVQSQRQGVKMTDFGVARVYFTSHLGSWPTDADCGTLGCLPPEMVHDFRNADLRTDQYAMGAVLYFLLTGHYPHDTAAPLPAVLARIAVGEPVPILERRAHLPHSLSQVVHRALSRSPSDRFASVDALRDALTPFAGG